MRGEKQGIPSCSLLDSTVCLQFLRPQRQGPDQFRKKAPTSSLGQPWWPARNCLDSACHADGALACSLGFWGPTPPGLQLQEWSFCYPSPSSSLASTSLGALLPLARPLRATDLPAYTPLLTHFSSIPEP